MKSKITIDDVNALGIGAGILGTGGGGDPYLEGIQLRRELEKHGSQTLLDPQMIDENVLAVVVGMIGAPTAGIEKLREGTEIIRAVRLLERHLGQKFGAIVIAEIGGANSMGPLVTGLQAGVPTVDGDGMGRAFPELQMCSFLLQGDVTVAPLAMADAGVATAVIPKTKTAVWSERLARNLATSMGATAGLACMVMTGKQVKEYCVPYTVSLACRLGERVIQARAKNEDVSDVIARSLGGKVQLRGKITDVFRRTTRGWAQGNLTVESFSDSSVRLEINFQNEFLIAKENGNVVATVPDMICIVVEETGEPIPTERLYYGARVAVIVVPGAAVLKTSDALQVVGPRAFGYDIEFSPLPGDLPASGEILHD
ncbi:MAG: hydantoinase [Acidiferrobacteraceae bacterium]|nr:hydantoinase [Acidiferrobacteraceae bacterium]